MATVIIMPRQGISVESCVVTQWMKKVGDAVHSGDALFAYETDKAAFEEKASGDGTLLHIFRGEGDDVPCLEPMCIVGAPGEDIAALLQGSAPETKVQAEVKPEKPAAEVIPVVASAAALQPQGEIKASPRARNMAASAGVSLGAAVPTGPDGRIIARDVEAVVKSGGMATRAAVEGSAGLAGTGLGGRVTTADVAAGAITSKSVHPVSAEAPSIDYTDVKLSNIRKVIAKAMHESLSTMAQLTHHSSFDATAIQEYRAQLKVSGEKLGIDAGITLGDMVLFAVTRVLGRYADLNAHFLGDKMRYFNHVHLGVAVDTDRGLMVPVVRNADMLSLSQISAQVKQLAADCRKGTINPDLLQGGTFTVSNLGNLGVELFTPVINPPQTGILGVDNIIYRPRPDGKGGFTFYPAMGLSLTYDHRALDGAPASRFLQDICRALEQFSLLLAQ